MNYLIRKVPKEINKIVEEKAKKLKLSKNQFLLKLIIKNVVNEGKRKEYGKVLEEIRKSNINYKEREKILKLHDEWGYERE